MKTVLAVMCCSMMVAMVAQGQENGTRQVDSEVLRLPTALSYDGRNCVEISARPTLSLSDGDFTVQLGFTIDQAARVDSHTLIQQGETVNGQGWIIGYHEWDRASDPTLPSGKKVRGLVAQVSDEARGGKNHDVRFATEAIYDGKHHTVSLRRTGNTIQLMLDGTSVATTTVQSLSVASAAPIIIGKHILNKDFHVGTIDNILITTR